MPTCAILDSFVSWAILEVVSWCNLDVQVGAAMAAPRKPMSSTDRSIAVVIREVIREVYCQDGC